MNRTSIEWVRTYKPDGSYEEGFSLNPIRFLPAGSSRSVTMCQKVSPGCTNCYAENISRRWWPKSSGVRPAVLVALERTPMQLQWGDYRDVGEDGNHRYALITAQPRLLKEPIPWKGRQGFFRVPDDLFPPEAFVS